MAVTKKRVINIIYDIFTAVISVLDVITDILVTLEFFRKGRTEFFIASLVILGVAQVAYAIAFWFKFDSAYESFGGAVAAFCCLLPFSPILSFAFYLTANEQTPLFKCLSSCYAWECSSSCLHSGRSNRHHNGDIPDAELEALRVWMREKLSKHMGFIIEAMVEAFPQSILQLAAIVYFGDTDNYLSIASILLSMLSVSSKSFILSVTVSYHWTSVFFNWLSALSDFFGIFFIASFAFYVPPHLAEGEPNPFAAIATMWMALVLVTVVPFGLIGSIGINLNVCWRAVSREHLNSCIIVFVQIAWIVGLCITVMAMTIACHLLVAVAVFASGFTHRAPGKNTQHFVLTLISWIDGARKIRIVDREDARMNIAVSRAQHRVIRLCTVNRVLLDRLPHPRVHLPYDDDLYQYLISESAARSKDSAYSGSYAAVSLRDIKRHSMKHRQLQNVNASKWTRAAAVWGRVCREVDKKLDRLMVEDHFKWFVVTVTLPLYIVGRAVHLVFALLILLYLLFGHGIRIFTEDVPAFQTAMLVTYLGLVALWVVPLRMIWREIDCASYILPSSATLPNTLDGSGYRTNRTPVEERAAYKEIMRHYDGVIIEPVATKYCERRFGGDIAAIIMMYYGRSAVLDEESDPETNPKETDSLTA